MTQFAALAPVAPASGFVLSDNDLAVVGTLAGRVQISDPPPHGRSLPSTARSTTEATVTGEDAAEVCRVAAGGLVS